jgi:novobiocin biosynthesis protein NovU/D-mycarose 3-C-methyltransferase
MSTTHNKTCLACGSDDLLLVLDLNEQPLANAFVDNPHGEEEQYPLAVNMCKHCHHLQLTHSVDPDLIYKNYLYVSGTSQTYLDYMKWYARFVQETFRTYAGRLPATVLDIGCNDGSQLNFFKDDRIETLGVDPARNLHSISSAKGHQVVCDFWNHNARKDVMQLAGDKGIDVFSSQNAFAHIPDPHGYLNLVRETMQPESLLFISTSQADMILNDEFDTIYHEHISFFNVNSMRALAERSGLYLIDAVKTPIHGTSYIFVLAKKPKPHRVINLVAMEKMQGLYNDETYTAWAANTLQLVTELKDSIELYRSKGYVLAGYGAAAKGNTLLNFSKVELDFIVDDNTLKQNKFTPGMNIPVVSIDNMDKYTSDSKILFVPLAWNYFDDIKRKIENRRKNDNDKFLRYFPKVTVE